MKKLIEMDVCDICQQPLNYSNTIKCYICNKTICFQCNSNNYEVLIKSIQVSHFGNKWHICKNHVALKTIQGWIKGYEDHYFKMSNILQDRIKAELEEIKENDENVQI
jgi:hypothetical protein